MKEKHETFLMFEIERNKRTIDEKQVKDDKEKNATTPTNIIA